MRPLRLGPSRRLTAWLTLLVAVVAVGALMSIKAPAVTQGSIYGLPHSSQAFQVSKLEAQLPGARVQPALIVYNRPDHQAFTAAQRNAIDLSRPALARAVAEASPASSSEVLGPLRLGDADRVAVAAVSVSTLPDDSAVKSRVAALRAEARRLAPAGVEVNVTGGPAFTTDLANVFNGADTTLLLATVLVVAALLLITYRSPILWLIPLLVVGVADQVSAHLAALLAPHLGIKLDDASTGIAEVLVFGAGTDYALLLIARYRDQLRTTDSRFSAMRFAATRTAESVLASGITVTLSLATLLLASLTGTRALGFAGLIGILTAMAFGLLVLPAALVVCGRGVFWPLVPRVGDPHTEGRIFGKVGVAVARRPGTVAALAVVFLAVVSLLGLGTRIGLSESQQFTATPESVVGQRILASAFPAGASEPAVVIASVDHIEAVEQAAASTEGVASVARGPQNDQIASLEVTLRAAPSTQASFDTIDRLRSTLGGVPGAHALVGGDVASQLDQRRANHRDTLLIVPLVLLIVVAVLFVLLRSLLAPFLLVLTQIATYLAALGISWAIFQHVFGYPALDTSVRLYSFLFLIALGVDYNIFLTARAREETLLIGTKPGMLAALRSTGGVITSAGILLAAVFAVLGVLPLITLTEVGVVVCVGVLLDTLLVRTVLVPALVFLIGDRFWWPTTPGSEATSAVS